MAIKIPLTKILDSDLILPKGSDIYNINVYNENVNKIKDFINGIIDNVNVTLHVQYYNELTLSSTRTVNVDTDLTTGVYICEIPPLGWRGTLPVNVRDFVIIHLGENISGGTCSYQILLNSTNGTNKLYSRIKSRNSTEWSDWKSLGDDEKIKLRIVSI